MCCRFYIEKDNAALSGIAESANRTILRDKFFVLSSLRFQSGGEIVPGQLVPVIARNKLGYRSCFPMGWGYHMDRAPLLVNARSETAADKHMFQASWNAHRCVVPASYYYEWEHFIRPNGKKETGQKYLIQPKNDRFTWMCGIYRTEEHGLPHFVILTRPASQDISFIHDRMPLMIREEDIDAWINPSEKPEAIVCRSVTELHYEKSV